VAFTPRGDERTNSNIPGTLDTGDMKAYRHGGDGIAAEIVAARIMGYYPAGTAYRDVQVDANGVVQTAGGGGGGGAVTIADGADVAQGTTTDVAWVSGAGTVISLLKKIASAGGSAVSVADGADVAEGTTTDAAYAGGASATTISGLKGIYGKLNATLAVSGPLTDAQLRASAVPVSLASTTITGTVDVSDRAARLLGVAKIVDTAGANQLSVSAAGAAKVDGSAVTQPVSGTFFQATQPVSIAAVVPVSDNAGSLTVDAPVATPVFVRLSDGAAAIATLPVSGPLTDVQLRASAVPVSLTSTTITGSVAVTGPLTDVQLRASAVPVSGAFFQATQPVSIAATVTTKETQPGTGTLANIVGTGASQTIIASNANRRGATIFNDSGVVAYVKFGATASATSFTVKMVDQSYYEVPGPVYTGVIDAFWASGSLRVTEIT